MTTYNFSSNLFDRLDENDLRWDVTAQQFQDIQSRCSGNKIPSTWTEAQDWAKTRSEFLMSEAEAHVASECIYSVGEYDRAVSFCDYHADEDFIAYRTTSGTIFWIDLVGNFTVSLPFDRKNGNHHKAILLSIGGVSNADRDRWENTHLLPKGTPRETFESLWSEMKAVYDRVLVPHGFPVVETYAEAEARWAASQERLAEKTGGIWRNAESEGLLPDEEFEDYEDD